MLKRILSSVAVSTLLLSSISFADQIDDFEQRSFEKQTRLSASQKQDIINELEGTHPIKWFFWMTKSGRVFIADTRTGENADTTTLWEHSLTNFTWTPISGGNQEKLFNSLSVASDGRSITLGTNQTSSQGIAVGEPTSTSSSSVDSSSTSSVAATTKTRITKPVVGDCSTVAAPYGADAVKILADNGYKSCAIAGGVLIINSRTSDYNDGLKTYKMNELTQKQADLVAELLDLNQDGYIDDEAIYNQLKTRADNGTYMNIQSATNQTNEETIIEKLMPYLGKDMGVKNSWLHSEYTEAEYTNQGGIKIASQSMMLEEAVHLWHMYGYARAYPSVWGVSNDGCTSAESTAGCNWNQSTLTKLTWEAMTSTNNWYHHPENTTNNTGAEITGTCTNPSCAAIEFVKDLVVVYSNTRKADSATASSGTKFPQTKTEATTRLLASEKGKAFKAILDDPKYSQIINGFKYSYNPK